MIAVESVWPSVTVVVPSGVLARYTTFEISTDALQAPPGSALYRARGPSVAKNRNEVLRHSQDAYFWLIDDDHEFDANILMSLLDHFMHGGRDSVPDLSVVTALTMFKTPGFHPTIFSEQATNPVDGYPMFKTVTWADLAGHRGLYGPVWACNVSGMLIPRVVLEKVNAPWFQLGQLNPEQAHEDVYFCQLLREAGIPIYVDLDVTMGHLNPVAARPRQAKDGTWNLELHWGGGERLTFPLTQKGRSVSLE
jgi:hypothetical protein